MNLQSLLPYATAWIAAGVLIDLYSLCLDARRAYFGRGPSGIPMVSLLLFYLPGCQLRRAALHDGVTVLLGLVFFYLCCHFFIPMAIVKLLPVPAASGRQEETK